MADPNETPVESGGQVEGQTETPAPSEEPAVDPVAQKLEELERQNKEFQRRLTQMGREKARLEAQSTQSHSPAEPSIDSESWFSDPANATKQVLSGVLSEFEQRQEQKRQAERELARRAKQYGVEPEDLQEEYDNLMAGINNPDEMVEILANLRKARNTSAEIQGASQAIANSATRNARAVTAESTSTQQPPPAKPFSEMTLEEKRAELIRMHGDPAPEYDY